MHSGKSLEEGKIYHVPVMLEEVMNFIEPRSPYTYLDCTLGTGGHALEVLRRSSPEGKLIGIDKDEESINVAVERFKEFEGRFRVFRYDYKDLFDLPIDLSEIRGVILDLGLSSFQLLNPARGFSFNMNGPLDMRFSKEENLTAEIVLNTYRREELLRIFREYGEIKKPEKLVRRIVEIRRKRRFKRTSELKELVEEVYRWKPVKGRSHPAQKIFQALRIEVNRELFELSEFIERLVRSLSPHSRLVAITFHSLEDRIVKRTFLKLQREGIAEILTKKPLVPTSEEIERNFSARSSKLRCIRRA
ncbi:MAG: 16S rRNA (cytosine(1402)-N(4))-methyltransferase RsmH [Candidatus Aminicenantia bacterium]